MSAPRTTLQLSRHQLAVLVVLGIFVLATLSTLVLGPARGARNDIGQVRDDLHHAHGDIESTLVSARRTLARLTKTLGVAEESLSVAEQGLDVARASQDVVRTGVDATLDIRRQTSQTLGTLRQVITALGPLQELRGDITTVVESVEAGVSLARTTLELAERTLRDGGAALAIASETLDTLEQSRDIQLELLDIGRQTLRQASEINRKIPLPPVFPTAAPGR